MSNSISAYMSRNILLLLLMLLPIFTFTIYKAYQWGSDDSIHYLMALKAEEISQVDTRKRKLQSDSQGSNFRVFDSFDQLPSAFKQSFQQEELQAGEIAVHSKQDAILYLLPYLRQPFENKDQSTTDQDSPFYITHTYIEELDQSPGVNFAELFFLIIVLSIAIAFGLIYRVVWALIKPVKELTKWSQSLSRTNPSNSETAPDLKYDELNEVASQLSQSFSLIQQANEKEKHLLKSLSHELRTPLAITKASLELIEKTEAPFSPKLENKLSKIKRANQSMVSTSETLLWLWADDLEQFTKQDIEIQALLEQLIEANNYLIEHKEVTVSIRCERQCVSADVRLITIILRNLIRNAFQYTEQGVISIQTTHSDIIISNPASTDTSNATNEAKLSGLKVYGYGVGLYLVETVCGQQNWPLKIQRKETNFVVTLTI